MSRFYSLVDISVRIITASVITSLLHGQAGIWLSKQPLPTPRGGHAAAVLNGKIIVTGGGGGVGNPPPLRTVEVYDPVTDTWASKQPLPVGTTLHAMAVANGVLYLIGAGGVRSADVHAYDPLTDSWTPKSPMPTARAYLGVGVINGIIYAVGGDNEGRLATLEAYDPVSDSWSPRASMPNPRYGMGVGVINGLLYAAGGATTEVPLGTLEVYNPATNSWSSRSSMPTPRRGLTAEVVDGILYAISGEGLNFSLLATVEAYNPATDTWSERISLPTARQSPASATVNGTVYVMGGLFGVVDGYFPTTGVVEAMTPDPPSNVTRPVDTTTGTAPATLYFSNIIQPGTTTLTTSSTGSAPPTGFELGSPAVYYNLSTTASYSGPVTVCIKYSAVSYSDPSTLQLFHFENGAWQNITSTTDTSSQTICGSTTSLSPFAVFQCTYKAMIQPPIKADGSSVFAANRGVVPVKFSLTNKGVSTCQLPPAKIVLTRTAGGTIGPVNENDFLQASDNGSNFRIAGCQYTYNLSASSVGVGTYKVQIQIGSVTVGKAVFGLQ